MIVRVMHGMNNIAFTFMQPATQHASLMMKVLVCNTLFKKTEDSSVSFLLRKHIYCSDTLFELINIRKTLKTKVSQFFGTSIVFTEPRIYHF